MGVGRSKGGKPKGTKERDRLCKESLSISGLHWQPLGMSLRHQPLTGTYLCEGLSPGTGTYLVFDGKGDYTLYRQSGVLSAGTYAEDANGVYVLKGEGLTVPYVTYDGKNSVHFFSVPDTYTYQRISDIPTYINVEKP